MTRSMLWGIVTTALAVAVLDASAGTAQQGQHGSHAGGPAGDAPHRAVQRSMEEMDGVLASGRGAGLAFAADQQGYPGPLHVLELKDRLRLTAGQEMRVRALLEAMFTESRPAAQRLHDAERRLRELFAGGRADDGAVTAAVADAERRRGELRLVHLRAHLSTRDVLTEEQRLLYHQARWGD